MRPKNAKRTAISSSTSASPEEAITSADQPEDGVLLDVPIVFKFCDCKFV